MLLLSFFGSGILAYSIRTLQSTAFRNRVFLVIISTLHSIFDEFIGGPLAVRGSFVAIVVVQVVLFTTVILDDTEAFGETVVFGVDPFKIKVLNKVSRSSEFNLEIIEGSINVKLNGKLTLIGEIGVEVVEFTEVALAVTLFDITVVAFVVKLLCTDVSRVEFSGNIVEALDVILLGCNEDTEGEVLLLTTVVEFTTQTVVLTTFCSVIFVLS